MVISSLFLQDSAGSPNGSVTTRFLEEETLRSKELLQRLDVHIKNMKQENANTVSKYLGKDGSPQNGHWVPWSELTEICTGDDLSVWPFLFKKKNVFWQLVGNHKSCNMIGQDQCSKNDTKAVSNNFVPKVLILNASMIIALVKEWPHIHSLPILLTFDLSHGLLHPPPSSFWALEASVLFCCAFFSISFLVQSIFMYSVT